MNKLQKRIVSAAATISLLMSTVTPGLAATTIEISGNGSESNNTSNVGATQTTSVSQSNNANVSNNITANASTGDNSASDNTGGDVNVDTGDADVDVTVSNDLNHNSADVNRCDACGFGDATVKITGNGSDSDNTVDLDSTNTTVLDQSNRANVDNYVRTSANTGDNDADDNTDGDVDVDTGNATTDTMITNTLNTNSARIGGEGHNGSVLAQISGNGTGSENELDLDLGSVTWLDQSNSAWVDNRVYADADTGYNDAEDNTDGDVTVDTGNASVKVDVANVANSNSASVIGGEGDGEVSAIIMGNGSHSDSDIVLGLAAYTTLFQDNFANIDNYVDADADTGDNDANDNTGGEVSVNTGNADVDVELDTMANFNIADVECDCLFDSVLAKIAGNGTGSESEIEAELVDDLFVDQDNCGRDRLMLGFGWWGGDNHRCAFDNTVRADGDTGYNDVDDNTAQTDGDPSVDTGDVDMHIEATTSGNANVYGDAGDIELPFPHDSGVNLNISFDLGDLLDWLMSEHA